MTHDSKAGPKNRVNGPATATEARITPSAIRYGSAAQERHAGRCP